MSTVPTELPFPITLANLFGNQGSRPCWDGEWGAMTCDEILDELPGRSGYWQQQNISRGTPIALIGLSPPETLLWHWANLGSGLITVPLNPRYPAGTLATMMAQAGVRHALVGTPELQRELERYSSASIRYLADPMWVNRNDSVIHAAIDPRQKAVIIMTSGSSGRPKGVLLPLGQLMVSAMGTNAFYQFAAGDRWLASLPIFHIGGLLIPWRTLLGGGTAVLVQDPAEPGTTIRQHHPNFYSLVPTQLQRLLVQRDILPTLQMAKAIVLGGAPCPQSLLQEFQKARLPVSLTYGMTESASMVTATKPGEVVIDPRTVGHCLPGREVRLVDGVVAFRGGTRFLGYVDLEDLEQPFDDDGWFLTQDLGQWDAAGRLMILGRRDEVFQSGGENIAPDVIEAVLQPLLISGTLQVVAAAHPDMGHVPSLVVWSPDRPNIELLLEQARQSLAGVQRPRSIFWFEVPLTIEFKPSRSKSRRMVEQYMQRQEVPDHFFYLWGEA